MQNDDFSEDYAKQRSQTHSIWGVGRNYASHARELGNQIPSSPLIFLKAGASLLENPSVIRLPAWSTDVHHEIELALRLNENLDISHYTIALDLTERAQQSRLKKEGHPWTLAKSFVDSTAIGKWQSCQSISELSQLELQFSVNGELRQRGFTKDMIFSIESILTYLRKTYPLSPNDIILTGTPEGVGPLNAGDIAVGEIVGNVAHTWTVQKG